MDIYAPCQVLGVELRILAFTPMVNVMGAEPSKAEA